MLIEFLIKTCAFTGHRNLDADFSVRKVKREIEALVKKGVDTFYCGMAQGFDLCAAETVLKIKKKNPFIKLIACVPCYGQEKNFSEADKKRYVTVLKKADETVILADAYYNGCMLARNRYMADRADVLMAYLKKESGGTAYTVKYFQKNKPLNEIVFI